MPFLWPGLLCGFASASAGGGVFGDFLMRRFFILFAVVVVPNHWNENANDPQPLPDGKNVFVSSLSGTTVCVSFSALLWQHFRCSFFLSLASSSSTTCLALKSICFVVISAVLASMSSRPHLNARFPRKLTTLWWRCKLFWDHSLELQRL